MVQDESEGGGEDCGSHAPNWSEHDGQNGGQDGGRHGCQRMRFARQFAKLPKGGIVLVEPDNLPDMDVEYMLVGSEIYLGANRP